MRILVLGRTGMLGRYVYTYLKNTCKYEVAGTTRRELDAEKITFEELKNFGFAKDDVVINCIGQIKQYTDVDESRYFKLNTLFPLMLSRVCRNAGAKMIHVTTDCVFSGDKGMYTENSPHDAKDLYGISKSLGEPKDCTVIRTSIIGEELKGKLSLLEWIRSNEGKEINGFTNHVWNGITCLQFAKICEKIIDKKMFWVGALNISTLPAMNKYSLVKTIIDVYGMNIKVNAHETPEPCDRSMFSDYKSVFDIPSLPVQIKELKEFSETLRS